MQAENMNFAQGAIFIFKYPRNFFVYIMPFFVFFAKSLKTEWHGWDGMGYTIGYDMCVHPNQITLKY